MRLSPLQSTIWLVAAFLWFGSEVLAEDAYNAEPPKPALNESIAQSRHRRQATDAAPRLVTAIIRTDFATPLQYYTSDPSSAIAQEYENSAYLTVDRTLDDYGRTKQFWAEINVEPWDSKMPNADPGWTPLVARITKAPTKIQANPLVYSRAVPIGYTTMTNPELTRVVDETWAKYDFANPSHERPCSWLTRQLITNIRLSDSPPGSLTGVRHFMSLGVDVNRMLQRTFAPVRPFVQMFAFDPPALSLHETTYALGDVLTAPIWEPQDALLRAAPRPGVVPHSPFTATRVYPASDVAMMMQLFQICDSGRPARPPLFNAPDPPALRPMI